MSGLSDEEKKDAVAWSLFVFGVVLVFTGFVVSQIARGPFDIKGPVLAWGAYFSGVFMSSVGWHGVRRQALDDLYLKKLDLLWISIAAAGAMFAILEFHIRSADDDWSFFNKEMQSQKNLIVNRLDKTLAVMCPGYNVSMFLEDEMCLRVFRERNQLGHPGQWPIDAASLADQALLLVEDIDDVRHAVTYIEETNKSYEETWYRWYHDHEKFWKMLFKAAVLFGVALRFSKSATEVFWKPPPRSAC